MSPNKKTARFAGLLFLLMVAFGLVAEIFFRQKLFASNDLTVTANNILSDIFLYRAGITSDILMALSYLLTALALYKLLYSVEKNLAGVMVLFATAGSILLMFNTLNEFAPLYILSGNDYVSSFNSSQNQSLAMLFYNLYQHGYMIGQIFFALWVLPLGVLIYKSGFIPKVLGILFVIETIFGFMSVIVHFLIPNGTVETLMLLPGTIAEFAFMFWLLIRGINESRVNN
jgi:hypothetical protein